MVPTTKINENDLRLNELLSKIYKSTINGILSWVPYNGGFAVKTTHHLFYSAIFIQKFELGVIWLSLYDLFDNCVMSGCYKSKIKTLELKLLPNTSNTPNATNNFVEISQDNMNLLNNLYDLVYGRHSKLEDLNF
jgi:hypothetical protein